VHAHSDGTWGKNTYPKDLARLLRFDGERRNEDGKNEEQHGCSMEHAVFFPLL
jgi:hypothetical protein